MDEKVENYIKENLAKGFSLKEIKQNLLNFGRKESDIDRIFFKLDLSPPPATFETLDRKEVSEPQKPPSNNQPKTAISSHPSTNTKSRLSKLSIFIPVIILVGMLIYIIPNLDIFQTSEIKKSFSVPSQIHDQYLPMWKQLFMKENNIDENYFSEHIFPQSTDLNKKADSGEQFSVEYDFKLDWVDMKNTDVLTIKPKGIDHYLSFNELEQMIRDKSFYYKIYPILKVEKIISKSEAEENMTTCRSEMEEASIPFKVSPFTQSDSESEKVRLLYRGIHLVSNNQYVLGEVDLVTGETNCSDVDIQYR